MDRLSVIGPAVEQTSGTLGSEWQEVLWAMPLTPHFSEPGCVEQSNSKLTLLAGPPMQLFCLIDSKETHVLQIQKWKGTN